MLYMMLAHLPCPLYNKMIIINHVVKTYTGGLLCSPIMKELHHVMEHDTLGLKQQMMLAD